MSSLIDRNAAAFVHPSAQMYGRVTLGEGSSVWCNVVMRSELEHIHIGAYTNIQDFVMIHTDPGNPVEIGEHCSITHRATLHGCKLGDNVLIGINATVYNGAEIGDNSIVGQHAYVKDGTIIPENSIAVGSPARIIRTQNSWIANRMNAAMYHYNALAYAKGDHRAWEGREFEKWLSDTMEHLQRAFEAL